MFVVTVDFQIHPGQMDAFMPSMLANAQASLDLEDNCLQFDVAVATNDANHVFLYEVYRSKEDFDAHLNMPHFLDFNVKSATLVKSKAVHTFNRLSS